MSPKIIFAILFTLLCILASYIENNLLVVYIQILCYIGIVSLITSRFCEED